MSGLPEVILPLSLRIANVPHLPSSWSLCVLWFMTLPHRSLCPQLLIADTTEACLVLTD